METIILHITIITVTILFVSVRCLDVITSSEPLTHPNTVISSNGVFELGFFNPSHSKWYVGIWYKNIPDKTSVWVANRDSPLATTSGAVFKIGDQGNLVILDQSSYVIWSSDTGDDVINPVAQLLDSGNFVLRSSMNVVWQSFDHPTDTLLPGMKLGSDLNTGFNRFITSWTSVGDPSTGPYSFKLEPNGLPEIYLRKDNDIIIYRSGPWNGLRFSGVPEMKPSDAMNFSFVANKNEVYYSFYTKNGSVISRLVVTPSGVLQRYTWIETTRSWSPFWYAPKDQCDDYRECGVYGICDTNASPVCKCLIGFKPKNLQAWNLRDGSDGCVRKTELNCSGEFGFLLLQDVKLPESSTAFVDRRMSLRECEVMCRKNCWCAAYANADISGGGTGCVIWRGVLTDLREYPKGGQNLYVRTSTSNLDVISDKTGPIIKAVCIAFSIAMLLCGLIIYIVWKKKKGFQSIRKTDIEQKGPLEKSRELFSIGGTATRSIREFSDDQTNKTDEPELPMFYFDTIAKATDNFSGANKLGQGGFGCVYKGMLPDGEEIAVKRLSKTSGQGMDELMNELKLIARLQHRNLVRLIGCSIDMDEKMLIYEYLQNRSLDSIVFCKEKRVLLNWDARFNIICGIARGLLYLHQDSRFRIVHRDLKASNILLDGEMNPKISDFGMARIFENDQSEDNTRRIVGTYGYMSPEYAMDGLFSVKSDVFSFGVLVLEIMSGKKNRGFNYLNNELNLLGHAWKLWKEENGLELMDPPYAGCSYSVSEVLRSIHVGLLCVQERAEDRPTMSSVVLMLSSETATMRQPKQPGYCVGIRKIIDIDSSSTTVRIEETRTVNQVTLTTLDGR